MHPENTVDRVEGADRKDEIGEIAQASEILRTGLQEAEKLRQEAASREEEERKLLDRRAKLAQDFVSRMQALSTGIASSSSEVATAAQDLSETARETTRQSQSVAVAADQASANVQTVASATEEMSASVRVVNDQVIHSAQIAGQGQCRSRRCERTHSVSGSRSRGHWRRHRADQWHRSPDQPLGS